MSAVPGGPVSEAQGLSLRVDCAERNGFHAGLVPGRMSEADLAMFQRINIFALG